jgi:putative membrane protein
LFVQTPGVDPKSLSWVVAYVYLAYVFLGQVPSLGETWVFSVTAASTLLIFLCLFHSLVNLGWKAASKYFAVALVVSYAIEFIGTETGVPFGKYSYTNGLAPLLGPVPVFIPFLWAALGYFSAAAAGDYVAASILMVLLDVSFDPRFSTYLWHWVTPGQYFGVPLVNFVGWFVTSLAIFGVFYPLSRKKFASSAPAIGFYLLFGVNNVILDVEAGLGEAGAISLMLFAAASLLLFLRLRNARTGAEISKETGAPSMTTS